MPRRLIELLRSRPSLPWHLPAGAPRIALAMLAFLVSTIVVTGAVMAWLAVKAYLLLEHLAWQAAKRMSGF